jgi:glucans biosynthesis protein C
MDHSTSRRPPQRHLDLDWVRIGAFLILILYHVGMFYVPWDWHVKSPRTVEWLQPVMVLTNPWRLTLLFIVSGAATRFMADKMTVGGLARIRAVRLLPPLLVGVLVIVPPQTWLQVAQAQARPPVPYGQFWLLYLTGEGHWMWHGQPLSTPTWNHLWFVVYLFVYTAGLIALLTLMPRLLPRLQSCGERLLEGTRTLWVPAIYFVAVRLGVAPHFPETHALFGDWTVHAESVAAFLFGYLFAKSDALWDGFVRWRRIMAMAAITCYAAYAGSLMGWMTGRLSPVIAPGIMQWVYGLDQWAWVAAILGFARHHLAMRDNGLRRYMTEAIFPFYLIHQTIIITAGYAMTGLKLPLLLEAGVLLATTIAGCTLFFEVVRRSGSLRGLFGLRSHAHAVTEKSTFPPVS